jgi:DNA-binding transcriptional ArsR family regulator
MPSADNELLSGAAGSVAYEFGQSLVAELIWAMMLPRPGREPKATDVAPRFHPSLELQERLRSFWGDGEPCFTELLVLADRGRVLTETGADVVLGGLEAAISGPSRAEPLESETAEDQLRFRDRIERLHRDPGLREAWVQLVRDVWREVGEQWPEAQAAVEVYSLEVRAKLARRSYAELQQLMECDFQGMLPRLVDSYSRDGRAVRVVASWLAHKCFVLSLPDQLLVIVPIPGWPVGPTADTRDRARRFKALGDPTRLAILEATGYRPHTVGELAQALRIAQPTVSTHVRILRDAGFLVQLADGTRRLVAEPDAFKRLAGESLIAIGG